MYSLFKPFIFLFAPEKAHQLTVRIFRILCLIPGLNYVFKNNWKVSHPSLERNLLGLNFPNPVGLAAGFDKDGKYYDVMSNLGFGFIEIGTVTPKPQDGNPKPRLFRLKDDEAIINRMGFNNEGVEALVERLKNRKKTNVIIGGNIGKNKITPNEHASDDYLKCFHALYEHVDYFVVNVSSPNTPNLRDLQDKEPLTKLLNLLKKAAQEKSKYKPILLKIAPDLTDTQLDDIVEIIKESNIEGLIATNTTIARKPLSISDERIQEIGNGGLSGKPLAKRSTEVISYLSKRLEKDKLIIGVGGITTAEDAIEKLEAGASLVQVYSGLIYEGPGLVKSINKALMNRPQN